MAPTDREKSLRRIARERCESGELPNNHPVGTWAGPGNGQPCALCDEPIAVSQVEYEVDVPDGTVRRVFRFHILCHQVWLLVCANGIKA